ncbi:hypothetical protein Ahy_A03g015915 [Arachis hypogaea]|uniref:Uncharacterized protein n=1 Tax=Arachis hypogaea TaxID=3818 RepID=A0A445E1S2_ARAHY|nr:hypothetical protein Ahy_A03g015915 [Arachis hypogaea]
MDLHSSILEKAGKCSKKCVKQLFFRIPISLKQGYVKYGKYAMLGDDDMRVIFHSQARFSDLGALELFAIMVDVEGSNGGSAPNMPTGVIEGTSTAIPTGQPATPLVLFPSFAADLPVPGDDLGDGRSFGQLAAAIGSAPVVDSAPAFMEVRERDPFAEAIGDDGSDSEPPIIGDESDGEENTAVAGGAQTHGSSGTQQYPRHFTTLDLEAVNQAANAVHIFLVHSHYHCRTDYFLYQPATGGHSHRHLRHSDASGNYQLHLRRGLVPTPETLLPPNFLSG